MTIGIYSLYWEEQDLIYIGQSQNIKKRFSTHKSMMLKGEHTNYKVQTAYNLYGLPTFNIIEECSTEETNAQEIFWTNEFNSLNSDTGLNIVEPGDASFGPNSRYTKYSKSTILKIFSLLYKTIETNNSIAKRLDVTVSTIQSIKGGKTHVWLKEVYPDKYLAMQNRPTNKAGTYISNAKEVEIISPEGITYKVKSVANFCRSNPVLAINVVNSASGIRKLINGITLEYKGWKQASKK